MTVHVQQAVTPEDHKAFFELPYQAYRDDPLWCAPLRFDLKARLDPFKNPSLQAMKVVFFIARRDGKVTGRIAAFINQRHLDRHKDKTGHFGFLDTSPSGGWQDRTGATFKRRGVVEGRRHGTHCRTL